MNYLGAPWRAELFKEPVIGCIFCTLPADDESLYEKHQILFCNEQVFVIMNRYPYNNGHLMVIPRRHVNHITKLPDEEYQTLTTMLRSATEIVEKIMDSHGVNLGMNIGKAAGAGIEDHCHFHVVPRWRADTNFMPVIGEVKVLNEHLMQAYYKLLPEFKKLS